MMRFSWFSKSRRVRQTQESPRPARSARTPRLRLEALEDRLLLSASTVAVNAISGYVYNDANNNGIKDAGEHTIANNAVNLYDATGALVASTVTDANGYYQFSTDPRVSTNPTTQSYTATFSNMPTNWTQQQGIAQFNPALGTLVSVQIQNNDPLTSDIKIENLDSAAQTVNAVVQGTLTLNGPGVNQLTTNLSATQSYNAAAFDGTIDFTGASGHDFGPQTATGSKSITITDPTQLAAYIGTGTVTFSETAQGTSTVTGS
ncbi:MAG TPA: choice-of-anchor E domain-containing protein, partial [Gemmataceae bacterium]|nr:choice-of-anchor E domain-containing protein [Gemmataceae bacterium]